MQKSTCSLRFHQKAKEILRCRIMNYLLKNAFHKLKWISISETSNPFSWTIFFVSIVPTPFHAVYAFNLYHQYGYDTCTKISPNSWSSYLIFVLIHGHENSKNITQPRPRTRMPTRPSRTQAPYTDCPTKTRPGSGHDVTPRGPEVVPDWLSSSCGLFSDLLRLRATCGQLSGGDLQSRRVHFPWTS